MSTIRVAERQRFTTIDRRTLNDDSLSFRARGVLAWLLDKPDGWTVKAEAIAKAGREGRDAVRASLHELEVAGYLVTRRHRDELGRWTSENLIHERPQGKTGADIPETSTGKPATENQHRETSTGFPGPIESTENEDCDIPPHPQQLKASSGPDGDDEEEIQQPRDARLQRAQDACDLIGDRSYEAAAATRDIANPAAYRRGCRNGAHADHLPAAQLLASQNRKLTPAEIAAQLIADEASESTEVKSRYDRNAADRQEFLASDPPAAELDAVRGLAGAAVARAALEAQRAKTAEGVP